MLCADIIDMEEFFSHENQRHPPSISENGDLYTGTKADLLQCFEELSTPLKTSPKCDAIVVDGMVMINMLVPDSSTQNTFGD